MQLFCQPCRAAFTGASHCPKCGGRLLAPQESFIASGSPRDPLPEPVPPSAVARVAVGLGVAAGLYFGLRELAVAVGADGDVIEHTLRIVAVMAGGLIAGAGRDAGAVVGLAVGGAAGALLALPDLSAGGNLLPLGAAGLLAALGGAAGGIGAYVWPPEADMPFTPIAVASSHGSSLAQLVEEAEYQKRQKPTRWGRIVIVAAAAAFGVVGTDELRTLLARGSGGLLQTAGSKQGPLIGLELSAGIMLLAGAAAAVGTGAGLRHGLIVGGLAVVGVVGAASRQPGGTIPAADGYQQLKDLVPLPLTDPRTAVEFGGLMLALAAAGGWAAGQVVPPLAPPHLRKRRLMAQT